MGITTKSHPIPIVLILNDLVDSHISPAEVLQIAVVYAKSDENRLRLYLNYDSQFHGSLVECHVAAQSI